MAKKPTKKKPDSSPPSTAADRGRAADTAYLEGVEAAFASGRYAAVRALTSDIPSDASDTVRTEAARVRALVALDGPQVLVGVGALLVVLVVAALTLHT